MATSGACIIRAPAPMTAATGSARDRSRNEPRGLCPLALSVVGAVDGAEFLIVFLMVPALQRHPAIRPRRRNSVALSEREQRPPIQGITPWAGGVAGVQ